MLVLLAAALIGDLILLPALLSGPAGRWFKPRVGAGLPDEHPHQPAGLAAAAAMPSDEDAIAPRPTEKPQLHAHFTKQRTDQAHRVKRP